MRLFAKRYLLQTALIAAAVFISNVYAKSRVRHSYGHHKNSVHENHLDQVFQMLYVHHKRSFSNPSSSRLSGSAKRDKNSHSSSNSKLSPSKQPSHPPLGALLGSRNANYGISQPAVHKPVSKPISSYNKTHGSGSGTRYPEPYHPTKIENSLRHSDSHPISNTISGNGRKNLTAPHSAHLTSYSPSNGVSGESRNNTGSFSSSNNVITSGSGNKNSSNSTNQASLYQKPETGTLYPPSHGLTGVGSFPSGSYQTTSKPASYSSSNRALTSSLGNRTNQVGINLKTVSESYKQSGASYPPNNHSSSDPGSHQTTPKPASYPSSITLPVNKPNVIYEPVVVHHIQSYKSHSSFLPHQKIYTYKPAYVYDPPQKIYFKNSNGSAEKYPVYNNHNVPPYVNDYWQSDNKYGNLLTGLAFYNLGILSDSHSKKEFHKKYVQKPDEICTFEVKYETGKTDEMNIDCILMTYFIFTEEYENHILDGSPVNNNGSNLMLINGTLQTMQPGGTIVNQVSDPIFCGRPVDYKLLRECNIGRTKLGLGFKKEIPCGLLQTYAEKSWRANSGPVLKSSFSVMLIAFCVIFI